MKGGLGRRSLWNRRGGSWGQARRRCL